MVHLLIKQGASVNAFDKRDRRALHWASYMGHENVVRILLDNGAEVNIRDKDLYTPLHAVNIDWNNHDNIIMGFKVSWNWSIEYSFNYLVINLFLLQAAASGQSTSVVQLLLGANADCNSTNAFGNTPLHTSCLNGYELVSCKLTAAGASISALNLSGQSPVHIAAASTQVQ